MMVLEWRRVAQLPTLSLTPRNPKSRTFSLVLLNLKGNRCESGPYTLPLLNEQYQKVRGEKEGKQGTRATELTQLMEIKKHSDLRN